MNITVKEMLAEANAVIDTVSVHDAIAYYNDVDVVFIDLRDERERTENGEIPGAVHVSRGHLEFQADPEMPLHNPIFASGKNLILYCASGGRSTLSAKTLVDMGVPNVSHIAGGFAAWCEAGGPTQSAE